MNLDIGPLQRLAQQAADLHATYQRLETEKDDLFATAGASGDIAEVRSCSQKLLALKPAIQQMVSKAAALESQARDIVAAAEAAVAEIESDVDDKLSDISAYAVDWGDDIDANVQDYEAWIADQQDEKSSFKPSGAHALYR